MTLGELVKKYRTEHELSLRDFSRLSGISNESNDIFIAEAIHFIFSIDGTIGFLVLGCSFYPMHPALIYVKSMKLSRREFQCERKYIIFLTKMPFMIHLCLQS